MRQTSELFAGIDVGTQGARVVIVDAEGEAIAGASRPFPGFAAFHSEQDPELWWDCTVQCLRQVIAGIKKKGISVDSIKAIAVTSTSGTLIPVDADGRPLTMAVMYNDPRAVREAEECNRAAGPHLEALGFRFNASYSLPKIVWLQRHQPSIFAQARWFLHPADYLTGKLTGVLGISDESNCLKAGYNLVERRWDDWIEKQLGVPLDKLPHVVPFGTAVGTVTPAASEATGLSPNTIVTAGMTDGCASQVATGAVHPGDWTSIIGTTLVLKGVTKERLHDPLGRVYNHRHPDGYWMPGGASNTGGEILETRFGRENFRELESKAAGLLPTALLIYPLPSKGERFPFVAPEAKGFMIGSPASAPESFAAHLEGISYIEKLSFDFLDYCGAKIGPEIRVAGGAAKSDLWLKIRASILNRVLVKAASTEGAFGAAVVAASKIHYPTLQEAARQMAKITARIEPDPFLVERYGETYESFKEALKARGYIT